MFVLQEQKRGRPAAQNGVLSEGCARSPGGLARPELLPPLAHRAAAFTPRCPEIRRRQLRRQQLARPRLETPLMRFPTAPARACESGLDASKGGRLQSCNLSQDLVTLTCSCCIQKYNVFFPLLNRLCSSQRLHLLPFSAKLWQLGIIMSLLNSLRLTSSFLWHSVDAMRTFEESHVSPFCSFVNHGFFFS